MAKIKLKTKGAGGGKAKAKTSKPAASRKTTSAARKGSGSTKRSQNRGAAKTTEKKVDGRSRQRADSKTVKRHVTKLEKVGARRAKLREQFEKAVEDMIAAARDALDDEVGIGLVADTLGISRQYLYKALETHANGKKKPGRPKGSGKKTTTAKSGRGPGRPKGSGKKRGPGRPKGSKNRVKVR
jgi:DNA-binding phage protein